MGTIANDSYGGVNLSSMCVRAGGDGVEAWRKVGQHRDEVRRIVQNAGVIVEEVDKAAVASVFFEVRLLLGDKETKESVALRCLFSDRGVRLNHLSGEAGYLEMIEEGIVERGGPAFRKLNGDLAAEVECVKDFFDEIDVVLGDDSAGVAGLVGYSGVADVEGKMEGEFAGDITGERALVYQWCKIGIGAIVGDWCGLAGVIA